MGLREKLIRKGVDHGLIPIAKRPGSAILMYHGVIEDKEKPMNTRSVSTSEFEQHLIGFKKYFHIVRVSEVFSGDVPNDRFSIALTFDDGLLNNQTQALPLLEKHGVPATFFVTGAASAGLPMLWGELVDLAEKDPQAPLELNLDEHAVKRNAAGKYESVESNEPIRQLIKRIGGQRIKDELYEQLNSTIEKAFDGNESSQWQLMTSAQIKGSASSSFIDIGSHGFRHLELGNLDPEGVRKDLKDSKEYLDDLLDQNTDLLAYPSGSYNEATKKIAAEIGLTAQLAVRYNSKQDAEDPRVLDRYGVFSFPCTNKFFNYLITQHGINS